MIAVLTKYHVSESLQDCDHDDTPLYYHNPHKNIIFLSLYRTMIMTTVLFIRTATMIAVLTKMPYLLVIIITVIMIAVLTKTQFLSLYWDRNNDRSPCKMA